jgi:hypothetical protein
MMMQPHSALRRSPGRSLGRQVRVAFLIDLNWHDWLYSVPRTSVLRIASIDLTRGNRSLLIERTVARTVCLRAVRLAI